MNAGPTEQHLRWALLLALWACLAGCERRVSDPPPPPLRHELAAAAPGAVGARLASRSGPPIDVDLSPSPQDAPGPEQPDAPGEPAAPDSVPPAAPTAQPPPEGVDL